MATCECVQERYWRISADLSSADLRRFATVLQAAPDSSSYTGLTAAVAQTSHEDRDAESDSSQEDVAMETTEDIAMETTPMRRHDSLKAKKRSVLAALAQKRQQFASDAAKNNRSVV